MGSNFRGWSVRLQNLIFAIMPLYTVQSDLFRRSNFRGKPLIREYYENWTPRKFPTIYGIRLLASRYNNMSTIIAIHTYCLLA